MFPQNLHGIEKIGCGILFPPIGGCRQMAGSCAMRDKPLEAHGDYISHNFPRWAVLATCHEERLPLAGLRRRGLDAPGEFFEMRVNFHSIRSRLKRWLQTWHGCFRIFEIRNITSNTMEKATRSNVVRAVPEGYHTVTPYLVVDNAQGLIDFIGNVFDGKVTFMMKRDDDKIMHATVSIGDSTVMVSDTMEGMQPQTSMLYLYLEDVDSVFRRAGQAKASTVREPTTEFYGDRAGAVKDQWGNVWWMATHVEDVDQAELERRAEKVMKERRDKGHEVHA